jgi:hypothetical protein
VLKQQCCSSSGTVSGTVLGSVAAAMLKRQWQRFWCSAGQWHSVEHEIISWHCGQRGL